MIFGYDYFSFGYLYSETLPLFLLKMLKVLEFYSGVGGMHFALERCAGELGGKLNYEVRMAFEINTNANTVYRANFDTPVAQKSIQDHPVDFFERQRADVFLMSPPCQPYTRQGLQKGSEDTRAESFFFILNLIRTLEHPPTYILIENVKGFETSETQVETLKVLRERGYAVQEFLLSPTQFGVPNSRLRYYLLAKRQPLRFLHEASTLVTTIETLPGLQLLSPGPVATVRDFLEVSTVSEELLVPDETLWKWGILFDIVTADSSSSCCFTKGPCLFDCFVGFLPVLTLYIYIPFSLQVTLRTLRGLAPFSIRRWRTRMRSMKSTRGERCGTETWKTP